MLTIFDGTLPSLFVASFCMKNQLTILNRIRTMRQQLGYSQEYMAELLGVSQQTYSNIEKHPERLTLTRLRDISAILKVDFMTFLTDPDQETKGSMQSANHNNLETAVETLKENIALYERLIQNLKEELALLRSNGKQ